MRHDDFSPRSHRAVSLQVAFSLEIAEAEAIVVDPIKRENSEFI